MQAVFLDFVTHVYKRLKKVDAGAADEKDIRELENFERKLAKRDRGASG